MDDHKHAQAIFEGQLSMNKISASKEQVQKVQQRQEEGCGGQT